MTQPTIHVTDPFGLEDPNGRSGCSWSGVQWRRSRALLARLIPRQQRGAPKTRGMPVYARGVRERGNGGASGGDQRVAR